MVRVDADSALPPGWTKYCSGLVLSFSALSLSAASSDCRDFLHMSIQDVFFLHLLELDNFSLFVLLDILLLVLEELQASNKFFHFQ